MRLAPNFTLREFTASQTAARRGIDNTPPWWVVDNLRHVAQAILQPIRDHFGRPVVVTSGYRAIELELALGKTPERAREGQHPRGQAADFEVLGVSNQEVAEWIESSGLPVDQLILEFHEPGDPASGWVHCSSIRPNRRSILTASRIDGQVIYTQGLPPHNPGGSE